MAKRCFSLFLCLVLCLSFWVPAVSAFKEDDPLFSDGRVDHTDEPDESYFADPNVSASDLDTSDAGIQFIKDREGFVDKPYQDVSQLSIGYGCSTVFAEKYGFSTQSITREEADQLLLCVLDELEQSLRTFLETYDIRLSQSQYDALISFTFNVGTSWMKPDYRLAGLLIHGGYTVNEFASAMGVWCHVGKEIDNILIDRRIREIKLFLYGAYELNDTYNKFCYLIYDAGEGTVTTDIAFFLENEPYGQLLEPELEGQYFNGWYTADGQQVTEQDTVAASCTVTARWSDTEILPEAADAFPDLDPTQWYYAYINDLYRAGVINGYTDGTFKPGRTVTTGEALKMILLAAGYAEPAPVASHWARGYLNLSLDEGILVRGDITDLDVPMYRGMMAKVAANALRLERLYDLNPYSDTADPYALALYDHGIAEGYTDGTFQPAGALTRAELAAIVWRIQNFR